MSRNPFGSEAVPRNLDNEHTFAQWFRVADTGSSLARTPDLNIYFTVHLVCKLFPNTKLACRVCSLSLCCVTIAGHDTPVRLPNFLFVPSDKQGITRRLGWEADRRRRRPLF